MRHSPHSTRTWTNVAGTFFSPSDDKWRRTGNSNSFLRGSTLRFVDLSERKMKGVEANGKLSDVFTTCVCVCSWPYNRRLECGELWMDYSAGFVCWAAAEWWGCVTCGESALMERTHAAETGAGFPAASLRGRRQRALGFQEPCVNNKTSMLNRTSRTPWIRFMPLPMWWRRHCCDKIISRFRRNMSTNQFNKKIWSRVIYFHFYGTNLLLDTQMAMIQN